MRSWLVIEAGNAKKMSKAPMVGADAVVVDLADIPSDDTAVGIRAEVATWLTTYSDPLVVSRAFARWVRIKPLDAPLWREDLVAVMAGAPDGVVLPKTSGPDQIRQLASELYEIEQKLGLKHNSTKIMPQIGETPKSALTLADLTSDPQPRLTGFTWNAENLARRLGANRTHDDDGQWTDTMRHVRGMTLLLAKTMGVMAIETPTSDDIDRERGHKNARDAKLDGFTGMCASHPRQITAINNAFSLSPAERAEAEAAIGLFASQSAEMAKAEGEKQQALEPVQSPEPVEYEPPQNIRALG